MTYLPVPTEKDSLGCGQGCLPSHDALTPKDARSWQNKEYLPNGWMHPHGHHKDDSVVYCHECYAGFEAMVNRHSQERNAYITKASR